jgi:AraC-like DNA-binding protein
VTSRYWRLEGVDGVDLLRWDASTHRYARHSHEGYALGVVEAGAHAFAARGQTWTAVPGCVIVVNPEDAHDGRPATRSDEYSYRMIYVDRAVMAAAVDEAAGRRVATPFFAEAVVDDVGLAGQLREAHRAGERPESRLESEALLITALVELSRRHGGATAAVDRERRCPREVALAREYLREHFADDCSLAELAALAGVDRFQLLRAFRQHVGLPPHLYQTQLRLRYAKRLMAAGESAAIVAATVGFSDQSHLIRKFKAAYGITPGAITFNRARSA